MKGEAPTYQIEPGEADDLCFILARRLATILSPLERKRADSVLESLPWVSVPLGLFNHLS
jgi:hypothetical protein